MILFYAWTDTQIINAINVRVNVYSESQADLLIYRLSRISEEFIKALNNNTIFDNVYILEMPEFYMERRRSGIKEMVEAVFLGSSYRTYFRQHLKQMFGEKKYDCFLVGALWTETLLIIRYLKSDGKNPEIIFYEEGLSAYNGIPRWLYRAVPSRGIKPWIRTILYYGLSAYTYRKYVKGIFLYKPQISNIDYLDKWQIPLTKRAEEVCCELVKNEEENDVYKNSEVIYITEAPNPKKKCPLGNIYQILDVIYAVKADTRVVIKAHPIMQASELKLNIENYSNVYVDYRPGRIENYLMQLKMDDKVVITGNSTSTLYMKWVYEKTPYVILVDFDRTSQLIEYAERYVEHYDVGKAYIAEDARELEMILRKIWS